MSTTENAFKRFVASLFVQKNEGNDGLMHAASGFAFEAGEAGDLVKKIWANNRPLDDATRTKLIEEIGDSMFYQQALMTLLRLKPADVRTANVEKLKKRYPSGYSDAAALARRDKADAEEKAA